MKSDRKGSGNLVDFLFQVKRLIGIGAVIGVFYLTVPWKLINVAIQEESLTTTEFTAAINSWVTGLVDSILLIALLIFIAVLTYGPKVLILLTGESGSNPPRGPNF